MWRSNSILAKIAPPPTKTLALNERCSHELFAISTSPIIHLVCPPPPSPKKVCIIFVFNFSWVLQWSQEKLRTTLTQNFGGQTRCIMERCANGELSIQPPPSLKIESLKGGGAFWNAGAGAEGGSSPTQPNAYPYSDFPECPLRCSIVGTSKPPCSLHSVYCVRNRFVTMRGTSCLMSQVNCQVYLCGF